MNWFFLFGNKISKGLQYLLILPIRGYKKYISPCIGHHCRFEPTCSIYMIESIQMHGICKGLLLGCWRLLRCNPFAAWGYDPVPEKGRWQNPKRRLTPWRQKNNKKTDKK